MKKNLFYFASILFSMLAITSCTVEETPPITVIVENGGGGTPEEEYVELQGNLQTQTLTSDNKYLLVGQVFVRENQVLTIEPGTTIFGDKGTKGTLVIDRGGKIMAEGTANEPIVFTSALAQGSRDRGDWGGIVILGRANTNQADPVIEGITPTVVFGGTNDADDSGVLKYVRVEFAGIELTPNNETNSITLGGVGSGTVMDYCQVSFGGDDGFEWFGGSVNSKYLITFGMWDDSFDVDYGFTGKVQFGLDIRYGSYADQSGSNIFETDNGPNDNLTTLLTTGVFSNITGIGPRLTNSQSINGNYQHALDLRRRTALTIANSVFVGMPRGIRMNQQSVYDNYNNNTGALLNNIMVAPATTYSVGSGMTATAANVQALWEATNTTITSTDFNTVYADLGLNQNIFFGTNTSTGYSNSATFTVTSGTLATGASFTNAKLTDAFFTPTTYRGAFGATDWTDGWAEFNPIQKAY
ncbi:hypothetical protein [Confluentibacter lentus]|uniref:hypothetical protein n=1 Tax=Confluentibacter lentus TaxID=1699412 RepID=UPI000C286D98|nr:hypothetical protein [Confluentibacter lentus]